MARNRNTRTTNTITASRLINSGALAIAVLAVTQLVQRNSLDYPLLISLYLFGLSMPLSAASTILLALQGSTSPYPANSVYGAVTILIGCIATLAGIFCLFLHFNMYVGIVFLVSSFAAYRLYAWGMNKLAP
jgi:hypothetical protein